MASLGMPLMAAGAEANLIINKLWDADLHQPELFGLQDVSSLHWQHVPESCH